MRSLTDIELEIRALGRPAFDWTSRARAAIKAWEVARPDLAAQYSELAAERADADAAALAAYQAQRLRPRLPTVTESAAAAATETDALRGVRGWLQGSERWCLVVGPVGTGKSVAARWAVEQVIETGRWALMTTAARIGRLSTWDDAGELDRLERADLLVVDDVGAEADNDHARVTLRSLLDTRHDRGRRTLLTSNLVGGSLSRWLGERISDRIASSHVRVETSGKSMRRNNPNAAPKEATS
jgi:DNA replication protein DnaC